MTESSVQNPGVASAPILKRQVGLLGATMMGMGSIIGTGVFVSIGFAAGIAGPALIPAIVLAGLVATLNALNSAQLAASHPVSGGTYEYGYKYLRPSLGFVAGWMFLCAKMSSAATAGLGFAGYLLNLIKGSPHDRVLMMAAAAAAVAGVTIIVLTGVRLSSRVNSVIVLISLTTLALFVVAGLPTAIARGGATLRSFTGTAGETNIWPAFLEATALMFVAYTGYGRIATLGEEVHEPRITIPRAIVATLVITGILYTAVAVVAIAAVGAADLGSQTRLHGAPLEQAALQFRGQWLAYLVAVAAMCAMLGVLLNLILGLSRVLLAMGRRGDMPRIVSRMNAGRTTPYVAVAVIGLCTMGLTLSGSIRTTWSFSAFTVLIYYAITNAAALCLPPSDRLYSRWLAWAGLLACLSLAFWVEWQIWVTGLGVLAIGLFWHLIAVAIRQSQS